MDEVGAAPGETYVAMREELTAFVIDLSAPELNRAVPQAPAWTVRDLVSHVVGVNSDIVGGNLEGLGGDDWTAHQVESRLDETLGETCAEWEALGDRTLEVMRSEPFMEVRLCADLVTHIHDLLGALGRTDTEFEIAARDGSGVQMGLLRYGPFFCERVAAAGLAPLRLTATDAPLSWESQSGTPVVELRGSTFDLLRAVSGRRSAAQVQAMDWSRNPDSVDLLPYIEVISPYGMPTTDVPE